MISVTAAIQQITACRTSWGKSQVDAGEAPGRVLAVSPATELPATGKVVLPPAGTLLASRHLAAMKLSGIAHLSVFTPPTAVYIGVAEGEGRIVPGINELTIAGTLAGYGIALRESHIVPAGSPALQKAVEESLDADLLVLCGNIPPKIFTGMAVEQVFNRVKAHPFQAFWFGYSPTKTRVMLMPAQPFAVQVAAKLFLETYIRAGWGMKPLRPWLLPYAEHRTPVVPQDEFVPAATLHRNGLKVRAMSFSGQTDLTLAAQSDGFLCHGVEQGSLEPSSLVPFYPWNDIS